MLFLDELNGSSHEVQKAFYSLILDRRLGNYTLHPESVVIGAGNRSQDSAIVRPISSALVNRMVHVHLVSSPPRPGWHLITDAWIDRVRIKREHAYLIPAGAVLPFPTRGPVFRFS